jgi:putative ABC transport system permease protein
MAILRSIGARPWQVFGLLMAESFVLSLAGAAFGVILAYGTVVVAGPLLERQFGVFVPLRMLDSTDVSILTLIVIAGLAVGALPAIQAYRNTLSDGLQIRL